MVDWKAVMMQQAHCQDLAEEARIDRLIRQGVRRSRVAGWRRALAWLGARLIVWGGALQARGAPVIPAAKLAADRGH